MNRTCSRRESLLVGSSRKAAGAVSIAVLFFCALAAFGGSARAGIVLEGQNKGDLTHWYAGNLQNWRELDYIPCRVHFSAAQGSNQSITVFFEHRNNNVPGIENLFNFSGSNNIVIVGAPVLSAPAGSSTWSYILTVNVLNNQDGYVWFTARLAAGAHLNVGSSLHLTGNPSSMGTLQIHKPQARVGKPNLAVFKTGPGSARPGEQINYVLTYTNRLGSTDHGTGVQLSDILPQGVTVNSSALPAGGILVGNTIYWDLPDLAAGTGGSITFPALIAGTVPFGSSLTNYGQILSAENDCDYSDNETTWVTTLISCTPPKITTPPASQTNCPGTTAIFNVAATGTELTYQWYRGNTLLAGASSSTLVIANISNSDAGSYSVVVSGLCGTPITNTASLMVNQKVLISTAPCSQTNCAGTTARFDVTASGTGLTYQWYKGGALLGSQTASSLVITNVAAASAGVYSVVVSGVCGNPITNSVALVVNDNVVIAAGPINQTNCPGGTAVFHVDATGTSLAYQWYKGPAALFGENGANLVITNIGAPNAGTYSVVVSGACGQPITNSAALVVSENVTIISSPSDLTTCPGTTATFKISATGTGLRYQWFKGMELLVGESSSALIITNVSSANGGIYSVVVSGACGTPITNSAALMVNESLIVSSSPVNQTNCPNTTATFHIEATGAGIVYQWYQGSNLLPGETSASLVITNVTAANAGVYSVVVSGTCGNAITNSATLLVNEPLTVATAPGNLTNCPGTTASFHIDALGTGISYRWFKGDTELIGETRPELVLTNVTATNAGIYSVVVSGICGQPITNSAALVLSETVTVLSTPTSLTNCPGATATFKIDANGTARRYQWFKGTDVLYGETAPSLVITNVSSANAGTYSVVVSGACGDSITNSAELVVNEPVLITTAPSNETNCPGTIATFHASATGTGLRYQWSNAGGPLPAETNADLVITNVSASSAGDYRVVVSGTCGGAITNTATLVVNQHLMITRSPVDQVTCAGTTASFSINATGTALTYQWYKGAAILNAETGTTLSLTNIVRSDAGIYSVVVSSACGASTNSATLTVNDLTITSGLASATRNLGESVTFSTTAAGTGPFTYFWKKNGNLIPGATTNSLTLANLTFADAANYSVEVTGTCNTAIQNATLNVNHPPTVDIFAPTNGATFVGPATFTLAANAADVDGVVTNVEFFLYSTNKFGETTNSSPATIILTNLPAGAYSFIAQATDDLGARGTSAPVQITVIQHLPLSIISSMRLNPQTGLFEQAVRVFNPSYSDINAVRVYIGSLNTNTTQVYNRSGIINGTPYVESHAVVLPGSYVELTIEYYVPTRVPPNPVLTADLVPPAQSVTNPALGTQQHIDRGLMLANQSFLVEFLTISNRLYSIQYSTDLRNWKDAQPAVRGNGTRIQWLDNGQPKTDSAPPSTITRFYRVVLLP